VDHCRKSGGGLFYANREEFVAALTRLLQDDALRTKLGENGRRYVRQYHKWDAVVGRMERLLTRVRVR
jgi:glycosyltransferase involved in cell wall biosynthesis